MKIDFEHLGGIEQGSVELNDLTLFCGKNNSGKTYATYLLYGLLSNKLLTINNVDFIKPILNELKKNHICQLEVDEIISEHLADMIKSIKKLIQNDLPDLFGVKKDFFLHTDIHLNFDEKALLKRAKKELFTYGSNGLFIFISKDKNSGTVRIVLPEINPSVQVPDETILFHISRALLLLIFGDIYVPTFILPAERDGINLVFKELLSARNLLVQKAQNDDIDQLSLLKDMLNSRYARPVKDYIQFLSQIVENRGKVSDYCKHAQAIEKNVLGGKYEVDDFGNVSFLPTESKNKLPLQFSSSTVKTLFGLVFYLEHLAERGDYLMIDEPELNLHPDNQRQVARVLAQLVNAGLKVIVSTHSDYFVRELNNLLMLNNEFAGSAELQKKYAYQGHELLDSKRVSAYLFDEKKIMPMALTEEGIVAETFNKVINDLNQSSNEIYYAMLDAKELANW